MILLITHPNLITHPLQGTIHYHLGHYLPRIINPDMYDKY